jgi:hypothetical protein
MVRVGGQLQMAIKIRIQMDP